MQPAHAQRPAAAGQQLVSLPTAPANIHPAVARIVAPGNGSISYGSGTLVAVTDDFGLVITNWHVINEATGPISVHFPDGFYSLGSIQSVDRDWDLAAIAIRKPSVEPVAIANQAPRPGDLLTIAGYGSGSYRAATGRCTQYVAPGTTFPYEMVEVAVSARQGDSGGPILNSHGELAGVLFGEGNGRTSGSYCGRVRWFLSSVVPPARTDGTQLVAAPVAPQSRASAVSDAEPDQPRVPVQATVGTVADARRPGMREQWSAPAQKSASHELQTASTAGGAPLDELPLANQPLVWEDLAGATTAEQIKTVLAGVGILAILLHALRWLSGDRAAA